MHAGAGRTARWLAALPLVVTSLFGATAEVRAQPLTRGPVDLVLSAIALLGVPYKFGGSDPAVGLDCSGLVQFAARQALGLHLPRHSEAMSRSGMAVERSRLQPGDLVFFNTRGRPFSHVGVYMGEGQFVHAPAKRGQVRIENLREPFWRARFNGARRLQASPDDPAATPGVPGTAPLQIEADDPTATVRP